MITVKVPATSANMGPGFDSIGIALSLYNTISAEEIDDGIQIDILDFTSDFLPHDGRNLVYRAMQAVFAKANYKPKGIHIIQKNEIPVTRGLGSSSASIVGGIIAANEICKAKMTKEEMISFAASLEGHPDNTTPAITGGMAIAVLNDEKTYYQKVDMDNENLKFAVMIPDFILRTKKARGVLPPTISHADGVFNTGRAALLTTSIIMGNYDNLGIALDDRLHQQYRKCFIRGVDNIFNKAAGFGALGSYISGAGPAIVSIIKTQDENLFADQMNRYLSNEMKQWSLVVLKPDNKGAKIV